MSTRHDFEKQNHISYDNFPHTPVGELRNRTTDGDCSVSPIEYCDYHKLHCPLTPMPGRANNPIKIFKDVSKGLDNLNELAETFMLKEMHGQSVSDRYVDGIHVLFGVTRMRDTSQGMRYRNPNYVHYDERTQPIEDTDARLAFYERHKINPAVTGPWLAKHFGLSCGKTARRFLKRNGIDRRADRTEAMKRIGRTFLCIREWEGIPLERLGKLSPWNFETVQGWASRFGLQTEWEVPRDPRKAPFMRQTGGRG